MKTTSHSCVIGYDSLMRIFILATHLKELDEEHLNHSHLFQFCPIYGKKNNIEGFEQFILDIG